MLNKSGEIKILLIDDDKLVSKSVANFLKSKGYIVDSASSGDEAISKASQSFYSLIISDIRMPGMSGIEAIKHIKEAQVKLPNKSAFMFITGYAEEDAPQHAIQLGVTEVLLKPFNIDDFIKSVERQLSEISTNTDSVSRNCEVIPSSSEIGKWKFQDKKFIFEKPILLQQTNIMGNTYFAHYVAWQGEGRERLLLMHPNIGEWLRLNQHIKMITHSTYHRFVLESTFGDVVRIEVNTREIKQCSFIMVFRFFNVRNETFLGEGWQRVCFLNLKNNKLSSIPQIILDLIEPIQEEKLLKLSGSH